MLYEIDMTPKQAMAFARALLTEVIAERRNAERRAAGGQHVTARLPPSTIRWALRYACDAGIALPEDVR